MVLAAAAQDTDAATSLYGAAVFNIMNDELMAGLQSGMAKAYPLQPLVQLQASLITFSGAKSIKAQDELRQALYDADGTVLSKQEFERKAQQLNAKYNLNHLSAERNAALNAGSAAAQWQQAQASKEVYPYLRYKTAGDNAVRPEHAALNGVIRPIDDPFWSTYYPPNGYNCRCIAEPVAKGEVTDSDLLKKKAALVKVPKAFQNNTGATKEVFKLDYVIEGIPDDVMAGIFTGIAEKVGYEVLKPESGVGYGVIHPKVITDKDKSNQEKQKYKIEREQLQTLANLGEQLLMLPADYGVKNTKQPDLLDLKSGTFAELKRISKEGTLARALKNHLDKARKQGVTKVYVFIENDYSPNQIHDAYTRYLRTPEGIKAPFGYGSFKVLKEGKLIYTS